MAPGANGMASKDGNGFFEGWPDWAKFLLAFATMIIIGGVWVGLPVLSALESVKAQGSGTVDYSPMMSVYIAMTTATITGIFLFMTLRIDRGTRLKVESEAKKAVAREQQKISGLTEELRMTVARFEADSQRSLAQATTPQAIREVIGSRITEETLRKHVEAVLMVTANGEIVRRFAAEGAENLDPQTVKQLIGLLKEMSETLSQAIKESQPIREERGLLAKFKLFRRGRRPAE